jgi:hypothetical protein
MVTSVALHASEPLAAALLAGTVLVAVMAARLLEGRLVLAHQAEQVLAQAASATRQRPPRPG